eukprot:6372144-Amphidinium_carterae.1
MLSQVLAFDFGKDKEHVLNKLTSWETLLNEWETMSKERLSDSVKCRVLAERAPKEVRTHLLLNTGSLQNYDKMRAMLQQFTQADQSLRVPMDLSALYSWGKAKVKARGRTG